MKTIFENLKVQAQLHAQKVAIKDQNSIITYNDFVVAISSFSSFLSELNVIAQDRVAILLPNSINYMISIYAILNCRMIFIPLPYEAPKGRVLDIVEDCDPDVIITNTSSYNKIFAKLPYEKKKYIIVDSEENMSIKNCYRWDINKRFVNNLPEKEGDINDLAYIVYTSGSTGIPKGVAIRYDSLVNFIENTVSAFSLDDNTNYISMLPFNFDGAFGGIFAPLWVGGTLIIYRKNIIMPKKLIEKLKDESITFFGCTPALFNLLVKYIDKKTAQELSLKIVSIGGDFISKDSVKKFFEVFHDIKLYNRYGPTETTSVASGYEIKKEDVNLDHPFPIGKPEKGVHFIALNEDGEIISPGEKGELYIGGCQVMQGYWNDNELTDRCIVKMNNERCYKTEDYVTITEKGDYILLGRANKMIKKNGYRIFPAEIEQQLLKNIQIYECICSEIDNQIIAFCVLKEGSNCSISSIYEQLKKSLPMYMLPNKIIFIDKIPFNSIGKVDYQKLTLKVKNNI